MSNQRKYMCDLGEVCIEAVATKYRGNSISHLFHGVSKIFEELGYEVISHGGSGNLAGFDRVFRVPEEELVEIHVVARYPDKGPVDVASLVNYVAHFLSYRALR